jgi:hypothetical protein
MSDTTGLVDETAQGLRSVLGRLGEFFHIFDLSFFVAGAVSVGALCFLFVKLDLLGNFPFAPWVAGLSLIIACYVCGLICFSVGRPINRLLFRRRVLKSLMRPSIQVHQLGFSWMPVYLQAADDELWRLYIRLWQELAAKHARGVAYSHLSRYWAMAATYDSLAVSLLIWAGVLGYVGACESPPPSGWQAIVAVAILLGSAWRALSQGGKYYEFQVEDLVAALAVAARPEEISESASVSKKSSSDALK